MVHYKLILNDKRESKEQVYSVVVRITFNKNNTTLSTGIRVKREHWDANTQKVLKAHPNFQVLNKTISEFYLKIQKFIHQLDENEEFSFAALKERLDEKAKPYKINTNITFNEYSTQIITELFAINKVGNALVYQTASNRLIGFAKDRKLKFKEIDYTFLESFQRHLISKGVKQNSVSNYLRTIRAIYNRAIKAKIIDRSFYPFTEVPIKSERTAKRAVLANDLAKILKLDLKENTREWHARNYFFLSFSLIGISFTDLAYLKTSNIIKGRIVYRRRKTRKEYSIKITSIAQRIIKNYDGRNEKYLLPILPASIIEDSLPANQKIHQWIKTTNKWMKELANACDLPETLTTYVARHTWATTAKRLGYSNELIAEAMGHEYGNKITNIYLDNFEQSVIDELNERVNEVICKPV
ncbi:site-specific integrase [Daejeonella sp. JGW-45]|uniref:site-specific integrase n=1 Tax=Daejeonella sp. JGW-45 TaxID=3034148 RepID=UPI0023EB46CE|nr:site-specific integrase [Daejeonella sp. JGW-45]